MNGGSGDRDGRPASGARPGRRTARLWWLLGGGGVAIAAAGVAIGVFAIGTPASEPEMVVPTTIPPTAEQEVETPAAVSPTTGPTGSEGAEEDPLVPVDAHIIGDPDAPVTMVVFSSFTCPACAMFALGTEQEIIANYVRSGKVKIVYRVVAVGPESELAAEAVDCAGDQDGFVDYYRALLAELQQRVREASVVVIPEQWENMSPILLLECLLMGKPVVASRIGGIPEFIEDGQTGYLFDSRNPDDLAAKICTVLDDPAAASTRALDRGPAWARETLEPHTIAAQYAQLYQRLAGSSDASAAAVSGPARTQERPPR